MPDIRTLNAVPGDVLLITGIHCIKSSVLLINHRMPSGHTVQGRKLDFSERGGSCNIYYCFNVPPPKSERQIPPLAQLRPSSGHDAADVSQPFSRSLKCRHSTFN